MVKFKKLGDLCYISSGGTPKRTITDYWDNGKIPWVKISDIKSKHILNTDERITKQGLENSSAKLFPKDTIVYTIFATVGEVGILDITAATNQAIAGIQVKDRTQLRVDYLYYFLKSIKKSVQFLGRGVAQNNINLSVLKSISVPIPSFQEQTAIVKVLDSLNGQIKNKHKQLTLLSQLIKARFVEMFGDPVLNSNDYKLIKLSNLGTLSRGKSKHRPRNDPKLLGGPYPLIQTGDITNSGIFIKKYNNTYSKLGLKQSKMWPAGTLCITIAANIAQTAILSFDACFPDSVVGFIPKADIITTTYLHYWFSFFQKILDAQASQVAQKNINLKVLSNLDVAVPPITEQDKFLSFVQQVDKSKFENIVYLNKMLLMKILSQLGDVSRD
ncbi:restriction endonuclease subunit S [Lactobacillus crispatus]|uniref:restriction endonuclease subunit S n=3 Tax=Lactobacillus crispatus TaxID=47770 RepID=UPI0022E90041|nr:restriction endonuclease subunit S [Lactobacillus crispatus]